MFRVGKWSQSKETMTWTYVDFTNAEIRGEIIETFSSNNTINVNITMKDKKGNNLLRISSKANKIYRRSTATPDRIFFPCQTFELSLES